MNRTLKKRIERCEKLLGIDSPITGTIDVRPGRRSAYEVLLEEIRQLKEDYLRLLDYISELKAENKRLNQQNDELIRKSSDNVCEICKRKYHL